MLTEKDGILKTVKQSKPKLAIFILPGPSPPIKHLCVSQKLCDCALVTCSS